MITAETARSFRDSAFKHKRPDPKRVIEKHIQDAAMQGRNFIIERYDTYHSEEKRYLDVDAYIVELEAAGYTITKGVSLDDLTVGTNTFFKISWE